MIMEVICYATGKKEYPENSKEGIEHCQNVNPNWWIEMDLQLTKDEQIVLFHDPTLLRTTGVNDIVKEKTYSELKEYSIGFDFHNHHSKAEKRK